MGNLNDLLILLVLGTLIAGWMKLSRAREIAVAAARHHCDLQGLQLLDETVGLRAVRLRRIDGQRHLERGYGFDVSVDGGDRQPARLWMLGHEVTGLSLPTVHWQVGGGGRGRVDRSPAADPAAPVDLQETAARSRSNVVPLRPRQPGSRSE